MGFWPAQPILKTARGRQVLTTSSSFWDRHQTSLEPAQEQYLMTGTIKTLRADRGFGFIRDASGKEVFFHSSAIWGEGIDNLREGDGVEFEISDGGAKGPRATNVRRTTT